MRLSCARVVYIGDMSTLRDRKKCCLKVTAIPENYSGAITTPLTDVAQATGTTAVTVFLYRGNIQTPVQGAGVIQTNATGQSTGTLLWTPTVEQRKYISRYAKSLTLMAKKADGSYVNFKNGNSTHPSLCICVEPCAIGYTPPTTLTLAVYADPCPDCTC